MGDDDLGVDVRLVQYRRWATLARLSQIVILGACLLLVLSIVGALMLAASSRDLGAVALLGGLTGVVLSLHILLVALYVDARAAEWRPSK